MRARRRFRQLRKDTRGANMVESIAVVGFKMKRVFEREATSSRTAPRRAPSS